MAAISEGLNWLAASGAAPIKAAIERVIRACTFVRNVTSLFLANRPD
jgi:hypothetical protein